MTPRGDAGAGTLNPEGRGVARRAGSRMGAAASASLVNRTHRVVRERARTMQANRREVRGLMVPMVLSSALMSMLLFAVWSVLDQYDLVSAELPASSNHFALLLLWFLPVSAALVTMIWYRRGRPQADEEAAR